MIRQIMRIWALAVLCIAAPALAAPDADTFRKQVDAVVEAHMREQKVPGVAVAVLRKGEIVLAKGYGLANVEHNVRVTPDTIFQSGSVGKMFTAAAVMRQVEQGKMGLDDPVSKYLSDAPASWSGITIRHLLTHTSGIPNHGPEFDLRRDYSDDELAKAAFTLPLDFQPGARWNYSNTAYILLGIIVKKATGRSYLDILATDVFHPLGMKTARGISEGDIVMHRSAGYEVADDVLKNQDWVSPTMNTTADGSLYFSLNDMIAWARGVEKGAVLSPASWQQVHTPVRLNSGKPYPYGFGWTVEEAGGKPRLQHGGAWQGFRSFYSRYLYDDLSVIVLANSGSANPGTIVDGIAKAWDEKLVAKGPKPAAEPEAARRVTALVEAVRAGRLRREDIPLARADFAELANRYFGPMVKDLGALKSLELVSRRELGDDIAYTYEAIFDQGPAKVMMSVAPGGKASSFMISK